MKKVPLISVGVQRAGKSITPKIGKAIDIDGKLVGVGEAFDFTDDEIKDMDRMAESYGSPVYADPNTEGKAKAAVKGDKDAKGKDNKGGNDL